MEEGKEDGNQMSTLSYPSAQLSKHTQMCSSDGAHGSGLVPYC